MSVLVVIELLELIRNVYFASARWLLISLRDHRRVVIPIDFVHSETLLECIQILLRSTRLCGNMLLKLQRDFIRGIRHRSILQWGT